MYQQKDMKFKNFMHDKFEGYTRKKYIFNTEDNLNTAIENMKNEMKGCEAQRKSGIIQYNKRLLLQ
ncbi:TPA: hypothetical protein CPT92_00695 [Candidatus Gastranaerophilales bacterium HUM_13]|jgi:hypothetical protein|nr:MAG TPA: hypothetical protein CPT99_02880 [Candidatus Gastranaerophilales bacterium HUM_4]DAA88691.1 MAG TPA: hypothetical protein CPT87_10410 [Candidatus Gastranaerophilales bacterium HUM_5]DAB09965.1 MAG TPA: hypothetical protein CPT92_00695 [Candidatus Gastranaerophilales bacterium HUM_13]DAB20934.1 MAG TPA: hypothetical protein CPT94_08855 [Candidatus Gastranaerophilales bacterium HUM_22]